MSELYKKQGNVYFETSWNGNAFKLFVPIYELPMISGTSVAKPYSWGT